MIRGSLADRAEQLLGARVPFVQATVVRAQRPASVRPGDAALVLGDGEIEGFVGGTCAEASVRLHASRALETGEPLLLRLVPGAVEGEDVVDAADGALVVYNPCLSGGSLDIFLEPQLPSPRMVVVGASPIAAALRALARTAGYEVGDGGGGPRAGDAAFVVASHGTAEEAALSAALLEGVPYVALVASRRRGAAIRAALDVPDELRAQLHSPAGLPIGSRTPAEIAISILAEVIAESRAHPASAAPGSPPATSAHPPAVAVDPVCGMEVLVAATTPRLQDGGEPVYFCGEGCRATYADRHARDGVEQ
jgi:xanthine dehydrogenase accessory factor